ncbi:hypothetical protein [Sorangium sp. So ce128]
MNTLRSQERNVLGELADARESLLEGRNAPRTTNHTLLWTTTLKATP